MDPTETTFARLDGYGVLEVSGADAAVFLHAQLTNSVEGLTGDRARVAGWCSPKGRLLASFLVVASTEGIVLQVARDLAAPVAKRLAMYVLRSKAKVRDASADWLQFGLWGEGAESQLERMGLRVPSESLSVASAPHALAVRVGGARFVLIAKSAPALAGREAAESEWLLHEIRDGRPLVTQATQDQFVPQMANFELIGGIDFQKGCYPGQEIVARSQYRGQVKRRMLRAAADAAPSPGQQLFAPDGQPAGTVVIGAIVPEGGFELLAVAQRDAGPLHLGAPDGPILRPLPLPYAA